MGTKLYWGFLGVAISHTALFSMDAPSHNSSVASDGTSRTMTARFASHDQERQPLIVKDQQSDEFRLTIQPEQANHDEVRKYEIRSDISKKLFVLGIINNVWKLGAAGTFAWYVFYQNAGQ